MPRPPKRAVKSSEEAQGLEKSLGGHRPAKRRRTSSKGKAPVETRKERWSGGGGVDVSFECERREALGNEAVSSAEEQAVTSCSISGMVRGNGGVDVAPEMAKKYRTRAVTRAQARAAAQTNVTVNVVQGSTEDARVPREPQAGLFDRCVPSANHQGYAEDGPSAAALLSAASNLQSVHSNVASSQQPDQTDSSEVPPPHLAAQLAMKSSPNRGVVSACSLGRVDLNHIAALRSGDNQNIPSQTATNVIVPGPFRFVPIPSPTIPYEEVGPPPKRVRIVRACVPAPLSREALRVTDRLSGPFNADTDEGHYVFSIGDNLTPRFKIMRKFGEGTFGRVMECWDRRRSGYVAIKVIRAVDKYRDAAMVELQVLATLAANDPSARYPIVRLLEWFDYRGHICMVFDRLGPSIYDFLRRNSYKPFPFEMARSFMHQVLQAVAYMHSFSLVHTDLKPENILFLDDDVVSCDCPPGSKLASKLPSRSTVRLIDFGSATFDEDYHSSIVSTRHYRAPEIILGLGWSKPCDMWSLGCILVELLTGEALFQTHENLEHLAMMEAVVGRMPSTLSTAAVQHGTSAVRALFKAGSRLNWPEGASSKRSLRAVDKIKPLREYLRLCGDKTLLPYLDVTVDLCSKLMAWDPTKRLNSVQALKHPFFMDISSNSSRVYPR